MTLIEFKAASRATILACVAAVACGMATGCRTARLDSPETILLKPPPPRAFAAGKPDSRLSPFEQQFRIDTGETGATRRAESEIARRIKGQSKHQLQFQFDLSDWPEPLRSKARFWICVGASNAFTTDITVNLTFTQNGTGVTVRLDNSINIDNVALMGCDFVAKDGDVTLEIESSGVPRSVDFTLHTIVYVPGKLDAR